ncbi:MAG: thiamine-phosphate kinase [Gammaproteobacteria bacterium]
MDEFALIRRYFTDRGARREDVRIGVGDDAAVLRPPPGHELLLTTDSLIAGRHFPDQGFPPEALGHRALAINLSDIAAMGGTPAWALLALTLPEVREEWIAEFADGFSLLAERCEVALVGGNIARGPLAATVTVTGFAATGEALVRSGAQAGDALFASGALGGGAAGLRAFIGGAAVDAPEVAAYAWPEPRLRAGQALATLAHAAIDISDGLVGDLAKLLAASGDLGAELEAHALPLAFGANLGDALGPSDDYELLVAVPESAVGAVESLSDADPGCALTRIGRITPQPGIRLDGRSVSARALGGYRHFE